MNEFAFLLALAMVFIAAGAITLGVNWFYKNLTLVPILLAAGLISPSVGVLGYWTAEAVNRPAPSELRWENIAVDENATWFGRQIAWTALSTGWVTPEVRPGFFYSTASFGEGEDKVELIGLPGYQKWYRCGRVSVPSAPKKG